MNVDRVLLKIILDEGSDVDFCIISFIYMGHWAQKYESFPEYFKTIFLVSNIWTLSWWGSTCIQSSSIFT